MWLLLLLPALLLAAACGGGETETEGTVLYYLSDLDSAAAAGSDAIRPVPVRLEGLEDMETEEAVALVLERLGESGDGYASPLPRGTGVNEIFLLGRRVYVDLSRNYGNLTGIDLSLSDYCITLSLSRVPGVASVTITVEGQPLPLRDSQVLMEQDVLLSGMEDVVSTVAVELWFLDGEGALAREGRELELYEGQTLVEGVADALEEGPRERGHSPILPEGFTLRTVWLEEGVCFLSVSGESMAALPEEPEAQRRILEAVSRSFLALEPVEELRFLVDGEETDLFGQIPTADYSRRPAEEPETGADA